MQKKTSSVKRIWQKLCHFARKYLGYPSAETVLYPKGMLMQKIGVIYNPNAGANKYHPERKANLEKILGTRGILRETLQKDNLERVLQELHDEKIDILAMSGGDGTNQCVLTKLCNIYRQEPLPHILLLRGGTMNLLETSLKMYGTPEERLYRMVQYLQTGEYPLISHTLLQVNHKFGFIFGNGVVANFMREYYQGGKTGALKIIKMLCKIVTSTITGNRYVRKLFHPIRARVQVGQERLPQTEFTGIMAATEPECGLGFKPFYRAREEQGKLHFLAFRMTPGELIKNLFRIWMGKKLNSKCVYDLVTDKVVIQPFDPNCYTVDGEMLNCTKRIELSPGPIAQVVAI